MCLNYMHFKIFSNILKSDYKSFFLSVLGFLFFFFNLFCCCSITVACIFSPPLPPTPSKPTFLPCLHPPPWFCPCVLYSSSCNPLSPLSPPHSPLAIVRFSFFASFSPSPLSPPRPLGLSGFSFSKYIRKLGLHNAKKPII